MFVGKTPSLSSDYAVLKLSLHIPERFAMIAARAGNTKASLQVGGTPSAPGGRTNGSGSSGSGSGTSSSSSSSSAAHLNPVIPAVIAVAILVVAGITLRYLWRRFVGSSYSVNTRAAKAASPQMWDVEFSEPKFVATPADAKWDCVMPLSTNFIPEKCVDRSDSSSIISSIFSSPPSPDFVSSAGRPVFIDQVEAGRMQVAVVVAMPSQRTSGYTSPLSEKGSVHGEDTPEICIGFTDAFLSTRK